VILVTGSSGSGKSQLLRPLVNSLGVDAVGLDTRPLDVPIIDTWPELNPSQAAHRLGQVGLADAFTWTRNDLELSDGQRYRCALARALWSGAECVVADEFCNALDRPTARAIAWTLQKVARSQGIIVVAATSIDDLAGDLSPDVHLRSTWNHEPEIVWHGQVPTEPPLATEFTYERGTFKDWQALKHLHYAAGDPSTTHSIHVLRHPAIDHPAAVAILSYPDLHSSARNAFTRDEYNIGGSSQQAQRLNREVLKFSRIVVAPEFRCCSLTRRLIPLAIENTNARYYECVTAMGRYSPFLANLGFSEVPQAAAGIEAEVLDWAERSNLPADVLLDSSRVADFVDGLSVRGRREARRLVWRFYHHFVLHRRTRRGRPKQIPGPNDERWPEAFEVFASRCYERPAYFILGPIER